MKLSTGALWGVVVGLIIGALWGVIGYLGIIAIEDEFREFVKQQIIAMGGRPEDAERAVQMTMDWLLVSLVVSSVTFGALIFLIVGVAMALLWKKLKIQWFGKGALFAIVLVAILNLPSLILPPPPGLPTPPLEYNAASAVVTFLGPMLLAYLLQLRGGSVSTS
ncbi:MAG: hypothetical protein QXT27_03685 [Pyrobaculum sp.]